jgi:hypothetical protein
MCSRLALLIELLLQLLVLLLAASSLDRAVM